MLDPGARNISLTHTPLCRRKKCDEVYPICGHCTRLNLVCGREEPRALSPDSYLQNNNGGDVNAQVEKAVLQRRRFSILIPNPSPATILPPAHERSQRYLLKYYAQVLSMLCSTSVESNSFVNGEYGLEIWLWTLSLIMP